jgi:hypothetical protein
MTVNGQVAGVRASVAEGQTIANQLIVAPSTAAPATGFLWPLSGKNLVLASALAAVITTTFLVVPAS